MPLLAGLGGLLPMVIILILFLGIMTMTTRRNMKKQQTARQELENSMGEGARVMLTSGIYGTLTHVGDKQAIVELAPGAEIVVVKQAISKVVSPAEEEFSFADEITEPAQVETVQADAAQAEITEPASAPTETQPAPQTPQNKASE
ncbi:MAG: preprotein translocase subunit YajC [Acidipropionibacterium sp.]|jgi:preprotein translocase subunit YajC|nr:preprotein translocase subunit YajC [Acidipropionibacterium sp.]